MKDKRTVKAKKEGLRARSAYKLQELNKKYHFLDKAKHIIDLGSWPGGWSLVAAEYSKVTSVDLTIMHDVPNCEFIQGDLFDETLLEKLPNASVVLSDVAPKTTGDSRDQYKSFLLSSRALEIATKKLNQNGSFICKIFQGEEFDEFLQEVRKHFKFVKTTKPPSSKKESKEIYLVAMKFKGK